MAMSVVHIVYGEKVLAEGLEKQKTDSFLLASSRVMSLQGGLIVFIVGLLEVLTYTKVIILTGLAAYIPVAVIGLNMIAVLLISVWKHPDLFKATIPQFFIFAVIMILQVFSLF